jgi:hypothetical protein
MRSIIPAPERLASAGGIASSAREPYQRCGGSSFPFRDNSISRAARRARVGCFLALITAQVAARRQEAHLA